MLLRLLPSPIIPSPHSRIPTPHLSQSDGQDRLPTVLQLRRPAHIRRQLLERSQPTAALLQFLLIPSVRQQRNQNLQFHALPRRPPEAQPNGTDWRTRRRRHHALAVQPFRLLRQ